MALLFSLPGMAAEVAIGVFAYQGERAALKDWSPVLHHLERSLPQHRFRLAHFDAEGLERAVAEHRVDLVATNPGHYVALEARYGISRIATLVSPAAGGGPGVASAIVARADRHDVQSLSQLKGKRVAAAFPEAFGGYLVGARELLRQDIDPESDLKQLLFVGLPMERVVEAVLDGRADAGIVRACFLEQMVREGLAGAERLRVLSPRQEEGFPCALSTQRYPDWPIAVTRRTDPALAKAVAVALLGMPEEGDGPAWSVPADYQPVHELYRELRTGPYAYLRDITPEGLVRRFWPWILGALLALLAWIIHVVRVEAQVHRRTAELRDSLAAREAAERRTREHQEQIEHMSRLSILGELSGTLAHELNQPLAAIGNYARSLQRRQAAGRLTPEAVAEASGEIADAAERAGGVVRRIRSFARKRAATRDPVDLGEAAEEARRLIAGMLALAPVIAVEKPAGQTCVALADAAQIQQVLLNLIKNAIDAGRDLPPGRRTIRVVVAREEHAVRTCVQDRGSGLEPDQLARLFEPFFTTKPDGLGLGLSICKTIIEAHGGKLGAEPNADGPGMSFFFTLPRHEPSA